MNEHPSAAGSAAVRADAPPVGSVLQVNVSNGGVPKLPVERAWVGRFGVEGDRHREYTVHGGPFRAVCLYGIEAIERLRSEGHPVGPGSVGENLTTSGVDWSTVPSGTRVRVGDRLELEVWLPALPCATQKYNFSDGRFARISHLLHPADSRMYASVLVEGEVRPGDAIALLPPIDDDAPTDALLWARIDHAIQESNLRNWRAARAGGIDVHIVDDGEIALAATPTVPGMAFNSACGLRQFPNLLPMVLDHFRLNRTAGWLPMHEPPWPDAEPEERLSILACTLEAVPGEAAPDGVSIRRLEARDARTWASILAVGTELDEAESAAWHAAAPHLLAMPGVHVLVAQDGDEVLATGALHVFGKLGFLRAGVVLPHARGRGLQRALISARARLAAVAGADGLATAAPPGSISERNLVRCGFRSLGIRDVYRFDPAAEPPATGSADDRSGRAPHRA